MWLWILIAVGMLALVLALAAVALSRRRTPSRGDAAQEEARERALKAAATEEIAAVFQWVYRDPQSESGWERATVKWFNPSMGFGCLTRGPGTELVYAGKETMRASGFAELRPGQVLLVRYGRQNEKLVAVELRAGGAAKSAPRPR